jgi:hypothetical protein
MRVAARAMQSALAVLQKARSSELLIPSMLEWNERQRLVRLPEWEELDNELSRFELKADSR